jgi:3-hydroxybutyryl-CoA dehydrogenase
MTIKTIGVIGAGLMGNGIAHVSLLAGYEVTLVDAFKAALPKAVATMTKNMERQVQKQNITAESKEEALARLTTTTKPPPNAKS